MKKLLGTKVSIVFTEPWDFVTQVGDEPYSATIVNSGISRDYYATNDALLIKMDLPIKYNEVICEYFVAAPIGEKSEFMKLQQKNNIGVALTRVSSEFLVNDVFDLTNWRGGVAVEAEITLT